MSVSLEAKVAALRELPANALRAKYRELFGEESRSGNRQFLFRRVAWRLQALDEGGLPERARNKALELANDADLRIQASPAFFKAAVAAIGRDPRIPPAGTMLRRTFQGRVVEVKVLAEGFEFEGCHYLSLSAIASKVTGTRWNGFTFFGCTEVDRKTA
jgi:hypothetical protein